VGLASGVLGIGDPAIRDIYPKALLRKRSIHCGSRRAFITFRAVYFHFECHGCSLIFEWRDGATFAF
jgi:hypothetical protein